MDPALVGAAARRAYSGRGDLETVTAYLDGGADVNTELKYVHENGVTTSRRLLDLAVEGNNEAIVALLLARGARVDLPTHIRLPTLIEAFHHRAGLGIVRLLIDAGADVTAKGFDLSAISWARGWPRNFFDGERERAIVELLLDKGADINTGDLCGPTPLFRCGTPEMASLLLRRGVAVNARNGQGRTALLHLINCDNGLDRIGIDTAIARVLLEHGADVNAADDHGIRPIHEAVNRHLPKLAALLMEFGANATGLLPASFIKNAPDLPTAIAKLLVGELVKSFPTKRPPLTWPTAVLKWVATAPEAEAEIKKLKTGETLLHTRNELLKLLEDRAWDKRKHLVCCYFEERRLRREGSEKCAKTAAAEEERQRAEEGKKEEAER